MKIIINNEFRPLYVTRKMRFIRFSEFNSQQLFTIHSEAVGTQCEGGLYVNLAPEILT